jgi:hypothetical protein
MLVTNGAGPYYDELLRVAESVIGGSDRGGIGDKR